MLEREIIQLRGFRNLKLDGEIVGFQFRIRLNYYRGVWLSMLRPGIVTIDGEKIDPRDITWELGGKSFTIAANRDLSARFVYSRPRSFNFRSFKPRRITCEFRPVCIQQDISHRVWQYDNHRIQRICRDSVDHPAQRLPLDSIATDSLRDDFRQVCFSHQRSGRLVEPGELP